MIIYICQCRRIIYIYICTHINKYTYIYIYIYIFIFIYTHTYVYISFELIAYNMGGLLDLRLEQDDSKFLLFGAVHFARFRLVGAGPEHPRFLVSKFKANGEPASRHSVGSGFLFVDLWDLEGPSKTLEFQFDSPR